MPLSRPITSLELWPIRPFPSPDFIEDSSIHISSANLNSTWLIVFYEFCPSPVSVTSSSVTCLRYCIHLRSLTGAAINPRECREHANERRCLRTQYGRRTVWPLELPSPACTSQCPTSGARDVMFNEGAWIAFDWRAWCISYWLFSPTCAERYQTQFLRAALGKLWLGEGGTSFGSCYGRGELCHVDHVAICSVLPRTRGFRNGMDSDRFTKALKLCNTILYDCCDTNAGLTYWSHDGFWNKSVGVWSRDGIHPNTHTGRKLYKNSMRWITLKTAGQVYKLHNIEPK